MTTFANVCPVVGTTNTYLPPSHPSFDLSKPGQVCPITNASTDHHSNLHAHPNVSISDVNTINNESVPGSNTTSYPSASACPALKNLSNDEQAKELDEQVCPVVGPVTTVLPPDHPSTEASEEGAVCPITKATLKHHKGKVCRNNWICSMSLEE